MADSDDDFANIEVIVDRDIHRGAPLVAAENRPARDALLMIGSNPATATRPGAAVDPVVALTQYLTSSERRVLSLCVIGYAQHGKSAFVAKVFGVPNNASQDDVARGMTTQCRIHSTPLAGDLDKATHFFSIVDTPGDPSFLQDVRAGIALASSCLLCVDAVEGFHPAAEAQLRLAVAEKVRVAVVITKLDRLVTELKLPPKDAYKHLKAIVDTINVAAASMGLAPFSVPAGSVIFTSTTYGVAFTVPSMATKYAAQHAGRLDPVGLAKRLWGAVTYDAASNRFVASTSSSQTPSFVEFVLNPFYKVFTDSLSGGTTFTTKTAPDSAAAAVRNAVENTFGKFVPVVVDCLLQVCPTGHAAAPGRVADLITEWCMRTQTPLPKLLAIASISTASGKDLLTNVRVEIGELKEGQPVTVVTGVDTVFNATAKNISVRNADGLIPVGKVGRGVVAFVDGLSHVREGQDVFIIDVSDVPPGIPVAPASATAAPRVHVSLEPVKHEHQADMQDSLRRLVALHPGCSVRVEDAGEHVLMGTGELYLDVALHDLRVRFLGVDKPLRLSDPYVAFAETVSAPRGVLRTAQDDSGQITLAIVASPMPPKMTDAFERGALSLAMPRNQLNQSLVRDCGWDEVAAEGLCAVGPDAFFGPNVLVNDVLSANLIDDNVPSDALNAVAAGFRSATKRGPVCGEALRGVCFTIVELELPSGRLNRQLLTTLTNLARNVCRAAFLSAAPRLMEPYLSVDITTKPQHSTAVGSVLSRRRGNLTADIRLPSTPLSRLQCVVPLIDSFGFDSELRMLTRDEVLCTSSFAHWGLVPGDPMDDSVVLLPLQSATGAQLARDFALKTRRKKGLPDTMEML